MLTSLNMELKMPHIFKDHVTGAICQTPWSKEDAIFHGRSIFMDRDGCEICGTNHPKTRYVEDNSCVGCFMKHESDVFNLWLQGMPGRPEPFVTSAEQAGAMGLDWYYAYVKNPIVCMGGPHFRRTHIKTGRCVECESVKLRAKAVARGPRAIARAAGHRMYTPTEACPGCGQHAERNVVTNACTGCARPLGRPPGPPKPAAAPKVDGRRTPTSIMVEMMPDMIISRDDARANGFTQYRTGKPCQRGHTGWRYVSVGTCIPCARGNK